MTLNLEARSSTYPWRHQQVVQELQGLHEDQKFPTGAPNVDEEETMRNQQFQRHASGGEPQVLSSRMLYRLQRSPRGTQKGVKTKINDTFARKEKANRGA